jgi:hypothetical protein
VTKSKTTKKKMYYDHADRPFEMSISHNILNTFGNYLIMKSRPELFINCVGLWRTLCGNSDIEQYIGESPICVCCEHQKEWWEKKSDTAYIYKTCKCYDFETVFSWPTAILAILKRKTAGQKVSYHWGEVPVKDKNYDDIRIGNADLMCYARSFYRHLEDLLKKKKYQKVTTILFYCKSF